MAELLGIRQVTKQLGISERTVYRLIENDELHPFMMGNAWKFEQSDLDAYIERLRQDTKVRRGRKRGSTQPAA